MENTSSKPAKSKSTKKTAKINNDTVLPIETVENEEAIKNMYYRKAELIYGKDKTFNNVKKANKPYIVWLYGPPGSGKSSPITQKIIQEELGLCTNNAVSISLDALVEGLEPFQRKSAAIYKSDKTNQEKGSLATGLYQRTFQYKIDSDKEKTLTARRRELFNKAVDYELDILYEFVPSGYKDDIQIEIFDVLEKASKLDTYNVFVVYPFVHPSILVDRLSERPKIQMASTTPFFRYISPTSAEAQTKTGIYYFVEHIMPRVKRANITITPDIMKLYLEYKVKDTIWKDIQEILKEKEDGPDEEATPKKPAKISAKKKKENLKKKYEEANIKLSPERIKEIRQEELAKIKTMLETTPEDKLTKVIAFDNNKVQGGRCVRKTRKLSKK